MRQMLIQLNITFNDGKREKNENISSKNYCFFLFSRIRDHVNNQNAYM